MTRGTFYIITNTEIIQSNNFDGFMYPTGFGTQALLRISKVDDEESFQTMIRDFNDSAHKYTNEGFLEIIRSKYTKNHICFSDNDYERDMLDFSSDWLFFKNLSEYTMSFICKDDSIVQIEPGGIYWFYFGNNGMKHIY